MPPDLVTYRSGGSVDFVLRERVLALGRKLGWRPNEVIIFAEGVTGRHWQECGPAELAAVRNEYRTIQRAIEAKLLRRRALAHALHAEPRIGGQP
jgi:hypothetical protein